MTDLLICIRCHDHLKLVIDTMQAVRHCTSEANTKIVFAVDNCGTSFASQLITLVGKESVFVGSTRWGWGPGLYGLLAESITHYARQVQFNHFMSIDYDTLFIGPNVDSRVLRLIDDESIGLLGCRVLKNQRWQSEYNANKTTLHRIFGTPPSSYVPGEGVQGGCFVLTNAAIGGMIARGMLEGRFRTARDYTRIPDDHLVAYFVALCNLSVKSLGNFADCRWAAVEDPRGIEKRGVCVFHPTKLNPRNKDTASDIMVRNYFRKQRGAKELR